MKALIYKSTGSWYVTKTEDGKIFNARIKGVLKISGLTSTNPIAVGDVVEMDLENELESTSTITSIHDRRNYIARVSPHNKNQHHIVASNLDQSFLFATIKDPRTSQGFIDRFLVSCEAFHVPAVIVFNKADVYKQKEMDKFNELKAMYEAIGYVVILASVVNNMGVDEVKERLKDKTTLLSGHSGVGKSSLINAIFPELNLRTKEVSEWSGKGMHTTTFAEMFDLPLRGKVIDTPGIRELGLVHMTKQELSHYFPEMRTRLNDCQFNNCMHTNEPGCAIKEAVNTGKIHVDRYVSYMTILDTMDGKAY
ncbi:ribosome small subunit-dependent GTPase A [Segetibacter sp.]|jgi:ribosome biogenesis GTPase|uniref:ribosome small subunit-dependent GTPase A n=1 Tax=Segetibacter sp. TaxID=2231182 RepID=UPI0026296371|nr:ribosome small subunit-dependent GTPase A [Segetibacter sp.]MCW3079136.1 rsgA [Segetibacter sp.]